MHLDPQNLDPRLEVSDIQMRSSSDQTVIAFLPCEPMSGFTLYARQHALIHDRRFVLQLFRALLSHRANANFTLGHQGGPPQGFPPPGGQGPGGPPPPAYY